MATVLRLANEGRTSTLDFLNDTLKLQENSWQTRTPPQDNSYRSSQFGLAASFGRYRQVVESMGLLGQDTVANLLGAVNEIEAFQELARRWHDDPLVDDSVWLEFNVDGEGARRSLIYQMALNYGAGWAGVTPLLANAVAVLTAKLAITRHPLWESVSTTTYSTPSLSTMGGAWEMSSSPEGTAPGRIKSLHLNGVTGSGPIYRAWVGIRDIYEMVTGFESVWELEVGTPGTDATVASESGASPYGSSSSNKISVSFSTVAEDAKRISINLSDVTSSWTAHIGRYLVLARCKVSSGTTVALRLHTGHAGMVDDGFAQNGTVYVDNADYQLIELGELQMPASGWRVAHSSTDNISSTQLQIWAERIEGAGPLSLDALVMIPADHFVKIEGAAIQFASGYPMPYTFPANVYTDENDVNAVTAYLAATSPAVGLDYSLRGWYYPVDGGLMVLAAEGETSHTLNESIYPVLHVHPRWLSYRGS